MEVEVEGELASGSSLSALRPEVLESGRAHKHCTRDRFEEALMPMLKGDCANRRLAGLLMSYSGLSVVRSFG